MLFLMVLALLAWMSFLFVMVSDGALLLRFLYIVLAMTNPVVGPTAVAIARANGVGADGYLVFDRVDVR